MNATNLVSVKDYAKAVLDELQKEEWNYPYLCEKFISLGLTLSNMIESSSNGDCDKIIDTAKGLGYMVNPMYITDPLEWAEFASIIGSMEDEIRNIYTIELNK